MKKIRIMGMLAVWLMALLCGCAGAAQPEAGNTPKELTGDTGAAAMEHAYTVDTKITDVVNDPVFGDYGRLIFPVNSRCCSGDTLGDLGLTWYSHIDPAKTVEITNYMRARAGAGETVFYDIYTDEEKAADPAKEDTGLFFFKGSPGGRFAVCSAGGGFVYVGAMHDSFPHALELSKMGYNAFALIYRPGAQTACEDLARAIAFIFEHADELEVDTACYSLWGGSAGGRMAAYLGSWGPEGFGGGNLPRLGAVIMQYTGHSEYTENDPPTYACVGSGDGIASWRMIERRLAALDKLGISTEFHVYEGLGHGFGLGTGTAAEGWIQDAVSFWEDRFVTPGTAACRGFTVDNILHAGENGDIHYSVYIPESYDGSKPYALFFTLPGYEGLYFQGAAANLRSENFGFEAQKYHRDMIVVSPQLSGWGETSAHQTIALAEYFLRHYNIDKTRVYANGCSGGGNLLAADGEIMGWLFSRTRKPALSGTIPAELEFIPEGYTQPSSHPGTLEKLEYRTWESLSYEDHAKPLTKTAWVYLPCGYSENEQYNILYLSHGGWSNETTIMGTPDDPRAFKHIVDHAIEDGKIQPLVIVLPTYNNTSESDSGSYALALRLTSGFHHELVNDLIPAAESKYSTYAASTDGLGLAASRDHRAFGGFSMGAMNTWHTFEHCLDCFRYFAPSSGGPIGNGEYMADIVRNSGHSAGDFFIFTASGTEDFACSGFKSGVMDMTETEMFTLADKEADGNLSFREREGYAHDGNAANEYMYKALRFFWNVDSP